MKKSEFKQIIKPIVSECIKESLLEDGLISGIIAEVVKGMTPSQPLRSQQAQAHTSDPATARMKRNAFSEPQSSKLQEHRNQLMTAIGQDAYNGVNLFEGTTPAPSQASTSSEGSPLHGQPPSDPGVDISSLFGSVGQHWTAHMDTLSEKERE